MTRLFGRGLGRLALVSVFSLALVSSACGGAAKAASTWGDDAIEALARMRVRVPATGEPGRDARVLDDALSTLDDLVRLAPQNRTDQQTRIYAELVQMRAAMAAVEAAVADAARLSAALPEDATLAASAAAQPSINDELARISSEVLEDVACDVAAELMLPTEREDLERAGDRRSVSNLVDPVPEAIVNHVYQELAVRIGAPLARRAVAWQQYAVSIVEKRDAYAEAMRGVIQSPNGTVTRAYYHYVRVCLAPPN